MSVVGIKVKLGQVWVNDHTHREWCITSIVHEFPPQLCYCNAIELKDGKTRGADELLGRLTNDELTDSMWLGWSLKGFEPLASHSQPNGTAINDHVCKTCGNYRCSKTEKSCWKCGNLIT